MPRLKPPFFPAAKGLYLQPTIVNNVETLCQPALDHASTAATPSPSSGPRPAGAPASSPSPATSSSPGVYEVEFGVTTFRDLLFDPEYGGGIRERPRAEGFIPGGASAPWFFDEHLDLPLETGRRRQGRLDARLGRHRRHGRHHRRGARPAWRVVRFFARESCGKCTPCREGTNWLEKILRRILDGHGRPSDLDLLLDVCDNISPGHRLAAPADHDLPARARPPCRPSPSAIDRFRDEFEAYIAAAAAPRRDRRCRARSRIRADAEDAPVSDAERPPRRVTITVNGKPVEAEQGRAGHRRGRAQRHLHPALLLPPADGAGRHVPHVHRRDRHRSRARRCSRPA